MSSGVQFSDTDINLNMKYLFIQAIGALQPLSGGIDVQYISIFI